MAMNTVIRENEKNWSDPEKVAVYLGCRRRAVNKWEKGNHLS